MVETFEKPVDWGRCSLAPTTAGVSQVLSVALPEMDPWRTLGYQSGGLLRYLTRPDPGLARVAAFVDGTLAGILCVRYPWLAGPNLELIAILRGFQGLGVGAELMGWLVERSRSLGSNLWTTVSSFNAGARRFYARQGFESVADLPDLVKPGFSELLLRKRLEP